MMLSLAVIPGLRPSGRILRCAIAHRGMTRKDVQGAAANATPLTA
jgi:hypothetical protein